ncbi:MAG: SPFH domain-containing protein [Myxococcota bacterium]
MAIARPDQMKNLIIYKHPDETIAKWAQLTVDSDEGAVFFKDGKAEGILGAGRHTLDAATYPFLTGLVDKFAGGDVFKSEVYFIRTQPLRNDPIKYGGRLDDIIDPELEMSCNLRMFGEVIIRVMDPMKFILYVGQAAQAHDNNEIVRFVSKKVFLAAERALTDVLNQEMASFLQIGRYRGKIEERLQAQIPDLDEIGVQVTDVMDFSVTIPPDQKEELTKLQKVYASKKAELKARKMEIGVDVAERQAYVDMAQNPAYMNYAQAEALMGAGEGMAKGGDSTGMASMGAQMAVGMGMGGMFHQGFAAPQYQRVPQGQVITCSNCGFQNQGGKFCANCGTPLAPPMQQQPHPGMYQQPPHGYPQQGFPPQQQGFPQQGYPPQQGFPQQGHPQQGYPPQQHGYPPQGQPPQQQGHPQQGYPPQQQGYPPQGQPQQGGHPGGPAPQPGYPPAQQGGPPPGGAPPQGGYPPAPQGGPGGYPPAPGGSNPQGGGGGTPGG